MKLINKNYLFGLLTGILLSGTVVYAYVFRAQDINYDNTTSNLSANNVQDAINILNDRTSIGNATASDIVSGKTALVQGEEITGTLVPKSHVILSNVTLKYNSDNVSTYNSGYTGYSYAGVTYLYPVYTNAPCGSNCGASVSATINSSGTITVTLAAPYLKFQSAYPARANIIIAK